MHLHLLSFTVKMINKPVCPIEVSSLKYKTQNAHIDDKMNKGTGGNGITGTLVV